MTLDLKIFSRFPNYVKHWLLLAKVNLMNSSAPTIPQETASQVKMRMDRMFDVGVLFLQILRMRVVTYHEQLDKVYVFEFYDDLEDFYQSSIEFNQIIASTRFLS
jgi:hypothetical protein